jgi:DNA polymerase III gamma/tau subunit
MEIIGHKKQKEILSRLTKSQNVPHAILFSGPEKIGKKGNSNRIQQRIVRWKHLIKISFYLSQR